MLDVVLLLRKVEIANRDILFSCQINSLLSQCSLLGIWLGHCSKGFAARLLIVVLGVTTYYNLLYFSFYSTLKDDKSFASVLALCIVGAFLANLLTIILLKKEEIKVPSFNVRSLLLLMTSIAISCFVFKQLLFVALRPFHYGFITTSILTVVLWNLATLKTSWLKNVLLLAVFPFFFITQADWDSLIRVGNLISIINIKMDLETLISLGSMYLFTLVWSLGLQYKSQPKRREREQATLVKPEQPVRVPNQDVDPIDSSQPTEPDDKANDEPPGPIDLTV